MDQVRIGQFLRELRKEKGLTQEQLAEQFSVSGRTVSRWENGNNMPDISLLVQLSEFYGVDIRELIDGERKCENMNTEMKETLEKVAAYSAAEKESILKQQFMNLVLALISFAGAFVIWTAFRECYGAMAVFLSMGLSSAGSGILNNMKLRGKLDKVTWKKVVIVGITVCLAVMLLAVLLVISLISDMFG